MTLSCSFLFYNNLNDFLPVRKKHEWLHQTFRSSASVKDAVEAIGVPHVEVEQIRANGHPVSFSYALQPNDTRDALLAGVASGATRLAVALGNDFVPDAEGFLAARYKGATYRSFLDTGTNSVRFPDAELPLCGEFYCPSQRVSLAATVSSAGGASQDVELAFESPAGISPDAVGASIAGGSRSGRFVNWGLPVFFGRTVHLAIEGAETPVGPGPYWAF